MRTTVLTVLLVLVFAGTAQAQRSSDVAPYGEPVGTIDGEVRSADGTALYNGVSTQYGIKSVITHCAIKNVFGQKLFQINIKWHWSWWKPWNIIKAWNHETSYPSNMSWGWHFDGSYNAGYVKGNPATWVMPMVNSQFSVGGIFPSSYLLQTRPTLWAGGTAYPGCKKA